MKTKQFFSLLAFFFILAFASQASALVFGGIDIVPQNETIFMGRNDTVGVAYTFINNSNERKCIELMAFDSSPYISASFPQTSFCLNAGERTEIAASFQTTDAPKADFVEAIIVKVNGNSFNVAIARITVGDNESIEIIPFETDICRDSEGFVNVLVRNKTPFFTKVHLNAENESLLPAFEQEEIFLDAFQEKYVKLFVHTSNATATGPNSVSIYATTGLDYIKKTAFINVKDCEGNLGSAFLVTLDSSCTAIEKEKTGKFYFSVKNLTGKDQAISMNILSDLPNSISATSATLSSGEERDFFFELSPRASDSKGDHNANLIVWNENQRIEKKKCIRVNATSIFDVSLLNNNLSIRRCESDSFVFLVKNIGDTNHTVRFDIPKIPSGISARFSDNNFSLTSGQEKEVYLFVSVSPDANLGNYDLNVMTRIGSKTFQNKAVFKVLEKAPETVEDELSIESAPLQIQATENSQSSVSIKLRNNSSEALEGIDVSIKGLPSAITASSARGIEIYPSDTRNVTLNLTIGKIPAGRYNAVIEVKKDNSIKTREFEIIIASAAQEPEQENQGFISGLFSVGFLSMGGGLAIGLALLIIALLLLIAITGIVVSKQEKTLLIEKVGDRK
ncbi:MAG: hypothetical protein PHD95_04315 [Candidatus ainarchaeum sp.]|nr:hypothetical protein [Candidatus ainarchaeum sp.]